MKKILLRLLVTALVAIGILILFRVSESSKVKYNYTSFVHRTMELSVITATHLSNMALFLVVLGKLENMYRNIVADGESMPLPKWNMP